MNFSKVVHGIVILSAVFLLGLFVYLAPQVFVADSEFWSISLGYYFKEEIVHNWVYLRPLYYLFLWLTQPEYQSSTQSIYWARGLFVVNALVMLFFIVQIMRRRTGSYIYGAFAALLLLGNTGFLNQGFRIRSDLMATTLSLAGIYFYSVKKSRWWLIFFPLLATPKAVLQVVSVGPLYFKRVQIQILKKYLFMIVLVVLAAAYFNRSNFSYFINTLSAGTGGPAYFDPESFFHILNQLKRNPLFWALFVLRFYTWKKTRDLGGADVVAESAWIKTTLFCFAWMLLFTEKVQFFIASFLPYFAMHAALIAFDLHRWQKQKTKNVLMAVSAVVVVTVGGWWTTVNVLENNNRRQRKALDDLYVYMSQADIQSFEDFNCFLPPYCKERKFVGPHQPESNRMILESFRRNPPEVFYYLKKAAMLEPELGEFLENNYVLLGRDMLVYKGDSTEVSEKYRGLLDATPTNLVGLFGYDIPY